jgi:hypothetical protein
MVARGPFSIGVQERQVEGEKRTDRLIHVDLDHPRVSFTEGEPVFLPQGGNSPMLDHMAAVLRGIHEGIQVGKDMFAAFTALNLIEPVKLEVRVTPEQTVNLSGLHTITFEKLRSLDKDTLHQFHQTGYLQAAFLTAASVGNIRKLVALKQARIRNLAQATAAAN